MLTIANVGIGEDQALWDLEDNRWFFLLETTRSSGVIQTAAEVIEASSSPRMLVAQTDDALAQTGAGVAKDSQLVRQALEALVVKGDAGVVCIVNDPIAFQKERSAGGDGYQHLRAMGIAEARGYTKTLATFATALRQVNDAAQKALEMERLLLGEPTKLVGIQHLESMTMDEAEKHVAAAQRAFNRLKDKGITVLDDSSNDPNMH